MLSIVIILGRSARACVRSQIENEHHIRQFHLFREAVFHELTIYEPVDRDKAGRSINNDKQGSREWAETQANNSCI